MEAKVIIAMDKKQVSTSSTVAELKSTLKDAQKSMSRIRKSVLRLDAAITKTMSSVVMSDPGEADEDTEEYVDELTATLKDIEEVLDDSNILRHAG